MVMKVLQQLFSIENAQIAVYEPTVDLIKKILYPRFEEILSNAGIVYKLNKSEGIIDVESIGTIIFRSLENPDRIIGFEVHHSHVDELDTLEKDKAKEVWNKILGRNRKRIVPRAGRKMVIDKNSCSVYTTPEGYRFVYERWKKENRKGYHLIQASTYDNPFLPKEYIESLKESYPPELIEAYLEGSFVNLNSGSVYPNYDINRNHTEAVVRNDMTPLHIGMDFNVNHMSAAVGIYEYGKINIVDEISDVRDTPTMINEIKNKFDTGRRIYIYPDASGRSSKSVDASKSDIGLLREAGFIVKAPKKNPPVRDRIVSVNSALHNALGQIRVFVNKNKCPTLVSNLLEQSYLKDGSPDKSGNVDHMIDGFGYLVHNLFGISRARGKVGRFRI
jgi:PBSX family phage terminase large subunit